MQHGANVMCYNNGYNDRPARQSYVRRRSGDQGGRLVRSMKVRELIRLLEQNGWVPLRTRGDHRQFTHPERSGVVTVSGNLGRDIPPGTLNAVLKAAGLKGERR